MGLCTNDTYQHDNYIMIPTKILSKYMTFDLYVKYGSEESEKNTTVGDGDVDLNDVKRLKL